MSGFNKDDPPLTNKRFVQRISDYKAVVASCVVCVAKAIVRSGKDRDAFTNAINNTNTKYPSQLDLQTYGELVGREIFSFNETDTRELIWYDKKRFYIYQGLVYFRAVRAAISAGDEVSTAFNSSLTKHGVNEYSITENVLLINAVHAAVTVINSGDSVFATATPNIVERNRGKYKNMQDTDDAATAAAAVVGDYRKMNNFGSLFGKMNIRNDGGSKTKRQRKQRHIKQRQRKQKSKRKKN